MPKSKVTIEWFDSIHGIGCGTDSTGRRISLNARDIIPDDRFLTLKRLETILCNIRKNKHGYFAENIKRSRSKPRELERDTFLSEKQIKI